MTDHTPRRANPALGLFKLGLDVPGGPPHIEPTMTLLNAAYHAVQCSLEDAKDAPDPRTTLDLRTAQQLFMRAVDQEGSGDTPGSEVLAASSIELSLTALRRSWEIKAGLCQQMTVGRINRRAAGVDEPTRLEKPQQSRRKAWIAALQARLPWTRPVSTSAHDAGLRQMNEQYARYLEWLEVPEEVQRRVDARRERNRQMEDQGRMEDPAPIANVTFLDDSAPGAGVALLNDGAPPAGVTIH